MKKFFKEFKAFITKGNVFDMAIGLIIATAFNKIVSSLVNDILMPLITWGMGANSLADLSVVLKRATDGTQLTWNYGNFLQTVIDFLIITFSVFVMVKIVTASQKKFKEIGELVVVQSKKDIRAEKKQVRKEAKAEGRKFKDAWADHVAKKEAIRLDAEKQAQEEKAKREAEEKKNNPSEQELLKEIRDLLKKKSK